MSGQKQAAKNLATAPTRQWNLGMECWKCDHWWWVIVEHPGEVTVTCPECGAENAT